LFCVLLATQIPIAIGSPIWRRRSAVTAYAGYDGCPSSAASSIGTRRLSVRRTCNSRPFEEGCNARSARPNGERRRGGPADAGPPAAARRRAALPVAQSRCRPLSPASHSRRCRSRAGRAVQMAPARVERSESGFAPVWASARSGVALIVTLASCMALRSALRSALGGATLS